MSPGGRFLPECTTSRGIRTQASWSGVRCPRGKTSDARAEKRATNRAPDVPEEKRATCAPLQLRGPTRELALNVDGDTLAQPDGFKVAVAFLEKDISRGGSPRLLSGWDAARRRDEGVHEFIRRFKCNLGALEIAGLALRPTILAFFSPLRCGLSLHERGPVATTSANRSGLIIVEGAGFVANAIYWAEMLDRECLGQPMTSRNAVTTGRDFDPDPR